MDNMSTIRDLFRRKSRENVKVDPATEMSFIPSLDSQFLYLLGLEEVVHFRSELSDQIVYSVPKTRKARGKKKKKKSPLPAVVPVTPTKDPIICSQCNTDMCCLWKQNLNGALLCQSCFKSNWKKEQRSTSRSEETSNKSLTDNLLCAVPPSSKQPVKNDPQDKQKAAFVLGRPSITASAIQRSDQLVPKTPALAMSPDETSSSSIFYSDSSSYWGSPSSSDVLSSPLYSSPPSYILSLSEDDSSPYLFSSSPYLFSSSPYCLSSSDLYSSPLSSSPSSPYSSPHYSSKKEGALYSTNNLLAKEDVKAKQEKNETKNSYLALNNKEKTKKSLSAAAASSSSSSSFSLNRHIQQKIQVPTTGSVVPPKASATAPVNSFKQSDSQKSVPRPPKMTKVKQTSLTMKEELKHGQGKLQKSSSDLSCSDFSSVAPASCSASSHSAKSNQYLPKFSIHQTSLSQPTTSKTFTGSVEGRQQTLVSKPGCNKCNPSVSLKKPTFTCQEEKSQSGPVPQKVKPCLKNTSINKAPAKDQKIDKWVQKQKVSNVSQGTHSSTASVPHSSVNFHSKVTQQVLNSHKKKNDHKISSSSLTEKIPHNSK